MKMCMWALVELELLLTELWSFRQLFATNKHIHYYTQFCTNISGYDKHMYNMNMVIMYTITKIQLLTRNWKESNLNICFVT